MTLPPFKPTKGSREWIRNEYRTARFIRALWNAASLRQRRDPQFLECLVASSWTNSREDGSGYESTREWRNGILSGYLGVKPGALISLAQALNKAFPRLSLPQAKRMVEMHTGITNHYAAIRPRTRRYVRHHASTLYRLFGIASSRHRAPKEKIKTIADELGRMPMILTPRGKMPPFNPLTPVLACLDPHRRFPIMNQRTCQLLRAIGQTHNADGALALARLIGSFGIRDSFELDVYSQRHADVFSSVPLQRKAETKSHHAGRRFLPVRSECASIARLAARRVRMRREHNKLTNRFREAVFAYVKPEESNFDLLVEYRKKRDRKLLIEVKTEWRGPAGRMQIRQAIGQLFDYRLQYFAKEIRSVDLAILLPTEPSDDIKRLLRSLKIQVLWFVGRRLAGTIEIYGQL